MFNDRLRAARIYRNYTLQAEADRLDISLRTLQNYESGCREPSLDLLVRIADLLDVPTDFLLGRDGYLESLDVSVDVPREGPPRRPRAQNKP